MTVAAPQGSLTHAAAAAIWSRWLSMWNENPEIAHDIIAPVFRLHLPTFGATIDPSRIVRPGDMRDWVSGFSGKFEGLIYRTDFGPLVDGDKFACRWYGTGIYQGKTGFPGDVPGKHVTMVGVDILRIDDDGRIAECWTQGAET